ncbi:hypothetical protein FA15DRAFT_756382 [Coprinopsis marcescibilis]|uniref:Uncharacterized protein n=1 Tax=Coprinopsis marcescibilis TaxID=230819 RepID=A0A5C3L934_COPMA|nr:hypothetical protein FA15DRAFT_756382 [Coprinopsis marcescibilis]
MDPEIRDEPSRSSRPSTPGSPSSPMERSFDLSSSTIDELTSVLGDLNRVPSPGPTTHALTCCCGKDDCQNTTSWSELKTKLESRLILSAEVGQALLQKHEAYVRQVEKNRHRRNTSKTATLTFKDDNPDDITSEERLNREYDHLAREKAEIEKRLNHALVNNEVTEVSNKTLMQELQEAREAISRLTAHNARAMGWDTRLTAALKERDDMQQERDSESHRARLAESRFAALKDKTGKLQTEVRRLQDTLEEKRHHRLETSESLLNDAKSRLETIRSSIGTTAKAEQDELAQVVESLVNDNDILKRDNAELQRLLGESREDLHALQEELEEQRANALPPPRSNPSTPLSRHFHNGSVSSLALSPHQNRRSYIPEPFPRNGNVIEPPTPESSRRPLSPLDSLSPPDNRWNAFTYPRSRHHSNSSHLSHEVEDEGDSEQSSPEVSKGPRKLLLLARSRGVQTDVVPQSALPSPSPLPSHLSSISTSADPRSESSSFSESLSSNTSAVFEKATALLHRMTQADALTLTNRLKRQHLKGADLSHLSRTTVSNIVAESIELRSQFRMLLEDEKIVATCTRKDLRVLFKLLKDVFMEMGQMRVTLNDVIFDPSCAPRISELSLNPSKAAAEREQQSRDRLQGPTSWIAPFSRLFSGTQRREPSPTGISRSNSGQGPTRFAPKLGPALAASATTVNVEFSGAGVGRATTSLGPPQMITITPATDVQAGMGSAPTTVMNIFAGAPKSASVDPDPWIVLPRNTPRRAQSTYFRPESGTATIGRSNMKKINRLSRNVDAVIDSEQYSVSEIAAVPPVALEDQVAPLPQQKPALRRRGLSDSSIHSTFTSQGNDEDGPGSPSPSPTTMTRRDSGGHSVNASISSNLPWGDSASVLQALTRTVQNLRMTATGTMAAVGVPSPSPFFTGPSSTIVDSEAARSSNTVVEGDSTSTAVGVSVTSLSSNDVSQSAKSAEQSPTDSGAQSSVVDAGSRPSTPSQNAPSSPVRIASPISRPSSVPVTPKATHKARLSRDLVKKAVASPGKGSGSPAGFGGLGFLPSIPNIGLASWASTNMVMDPVSPVDQVLGTSSSAREDSPLSYKSKRAGPGRPGRGSIGSRDFL